MKGIIATITPHNFSIPFVTAKSLIDTVSYAKELYGYTNVSFAHVAGPLVEENRNNVFALAKGKDWLLMVDSDMVFEPHYLPKLIKVMNDKDAGLVCGFFKEGHKPHHPAIYKNIETFERIDEEGVVKVEGCGAAFILISKKVLESFEKPFIRLEHNGKKYGEDLSFCLRLKEKDIHIYCDTSVKVGHVRLDIVI